MSGTKKWILFGAIIIIAIILFMFISRPEREKEINDDSFNQPNNQESEILDKPEKLEFFPARQEDFLVPPKRYGLWPYGVRGIDNLSHNEGHPGWDFELKKGSKLYAVSDIRINQIHDGDKILPDGSIVRVIEASAYLKEGPIGLVYHSVINIEENVVEGATIKGGSVLAEVGYPISDESSMIHFGIFGIKDSIGSCPTDYFSKENQEIINFMVSNSMDQYTDKPYASACIGKINKELYYKNFPEGIQYLQGNEPFE